MSKRGTVDIKVPFMTDVNSITPNEEKFCNEYL
jgi:hypothetical protein